MRDRRAKSRARYSAPRGAARQPLRPASTKAEHRDLSRFKIRIVAGVFALLWLALWARAYQVQVAHGEYLSAEASRQHHYTEYVAGERGQIFDRGGRLLAKSVEFKTVCANPRMVADPAAAAQTLAPILGQSRDAIQKKLESDRGYVLLARKVNDRVALAVEEAGIRGLYLTSEYGRQYPCKHLAGRLLGFTGLEDKGLEGLESYFDEYLSGKRMVMEVRRDARGNKLYLDAQGKEVDIRGRDLWLTLDVNIQAVAEEALGKAVKTNKGRWGACMVIEVDSGDILAWAEYPKFNPNDYHRYKPVQWRNRIALDILEPGSTIKPFLAASALQEGVVTRDTEYFCENGRWKVDTKVIKDTKPLGTLSVDKIIRYSSNIGVAKVAMDLGAERYRYYLSRLGFGERTGLPLVGEGKGILRAASEWKELDLASAGFGQGVGVTVLQMARAYLCLANKGVTRPMHLVRGFETSTEQVRVFEKSVAEDVLAMMRDVVEEDGTGKRARINGLEVAGKTSTAQKASPEGGYGEKYVASFVGMVPADNPEYLVLVVVDEPETSHFGGVVAAPAFKEVMTKTLAYAGTLPDTNKPDPEALAEAEPPAKAEPKEPEHEISIKSDAVPNVVGMPLRKAVQLFARQGVVPVLKGEGTVVGGQSPAPGGPWPDNAETEYILWLMEEERS